MAPYCSVWAVFTGLKVYRYANNTFGSGLLPSDTGLVSLSAGPVLYSAFLLFLQPFFMFLLKLGKYRRANTQFTIMIPIWALTSTDTQNW